MYSPKNGRYFPLRGPDRDVDGEVGDTGISEDDWMFGRMSAISVEALGS